MEGAALRVLAFGFLLAAASAQKENCPSGWYYYRRHCYHLYKPASYTKELASTYCLARGAHLITYRDENEVNNVHEYLISHSANIVYYTGFQFRNGNFTTDDGLPVRYTNWAPGEPSLGKASGDCVDVRFTLSTRKSLWYVRDCSTRLALLCKKPSVCRGPTRTTYYYRGRCYTIQTTSLNQPSAVTSCRLRDKSELLSLHSKKEKDVVFRFLNAAFGGTRWLWTGLQIKSDDEPYQWVDKSFVDYSNWLAGHPTPGLSAPRCVEMYQSPTSHIGYGKWRDTNCMTQTLASVCARTVGAEELIPEDDDQVQAVLITAGKVGKNAGKTQCMSSSMQYNLSYKIAHPGKYSQPCLYGDQGGQAYANFIQTYRGDQRAQPGTHNGPLSSRCRCAAKADDENEQWVFDFGYTDCGTHRIIVTDARHRSDKITYVNNIYAGSLSSGNTSLAQSDPSDYRHITLQCSLDAVLFVSTYGYLIDVYSSSVFVLESGGSFTASSYFVRNARPVGRNETSPITFTVGLPVTYEFSLETEDDLYLHPMQCWISNGDREYYPRVVAVFNGCASKENVNFAPTRYRFDEATNTSSKYFQLSLVAFAFQNREENIYYLHCTVRICGAGAGQELCQPTCGDSQQRRQRRQHADVGYSSSSDVRQLSGNPLLTFTSPPFLVIDPHSGTQSITTFSMFSLYLSLSLLYAIIFTL
ncbi:uncharacterized protein LOC135825387 [Sycon ciliatum]|uniref:uncharacterized protein LOC135825387 n=1 Tax=Sycon ciliatum TaxID=27933 RepID=UPI0031F62074